MQIAIDGRRASTPSRPTACGAPWPPSSIRRRSTSIATRWSGGMVARGYARSSPSAASSRSRASAPTASPESHAASFAKLVYVSAWLKCHQPAVFACAVAELAADGLLRPGPDRPRRARACGRGRGPSTSSTAIGTAPWSRARGRSGAESGLPPGRRLLRGLGRAAGRGARGRLRRLRRLGAPLEASPRRSLQKLAQADADAEPRALDRPPGAVEGEGHGREAGRRSPLLAALPDDEAPMVLPAMALSEQVVSRLPHHAALPEGAPDGLPAPGPSRPARVWPCRRVQEAAATASRPRSPAWCWSASGPARARWCS